MKAWVSNALAATGSSNFLVLTNPTDRIGFNTIKATGTVAINWGDGSTNTYTPGAGQSISHTYASTSNRAVVIVGNVTYIYSSFSDGQTAFGGDISTMTGLTYLNVVGYNTLSGSVAGLTGLTCLAVTGSNTISGSISGLTGLTYLGVSGSNTLSGSITGLTGLTNISVGGSNTLSGSVSGLTALTQLSALGSNTISGSVAGLTGLTYINIAGSNTLSGSISGLTGLTWLNVAGSNTLSGSISGLSALTAFGLAGSNTVSGSLPNTTIASIYEAGNSDITNPADWMPYSGLCYAVVKGLTTQAAADNFLVAMDANKNATKTRSERTINCTSNCVAPSATGLAAKASLIAAGWTVTTN
jgi:hypothetical protein